MPSHRDQQHFDYTTTQLYELVSDVESYCEFLPWVKAVRIVTREEDHFVADVVVSFKHMTEKYRCRVLTQPPIDEAASGQIDVELIKGPFHHLDNHWRFEPNKDGGCEVSFHVDFAFNSKILDNIIGLLFSRATQKMVSAFSERAKELYG